MQTEPLDSSAGMNRDDDLRILSDEFRPPEGCLLDGMLPSLLLGKNFSGQAGNGF